MADKPSIEAPIEATPQEARAAAAALRDALALRTRLINDTAGEIRALLQQAADDIAELLRRQPSDYQKWYLPQLQAEIGRVLAATAADGSGVVESGVSSSIAAGRGMVDGAIAAGAPAVQASLPILQVAQLEAMTAFATSKISGITLEAANAINTQLGLVMIGGQTPFDAVDAVSGILGEDTLRRGVTIVHTQLAQAYSAATQARVEQWAEVVPGLQKRWLPSNKLNPRENHLLVAKQLVAANKPFVVPTKKGPVKMMHPHDPTAPAGEVINCGCTAIPVVPGWESALPKTAD